MHDTGIRRAEDSDFEGIWAIFHEVVQAGDTYLYDPDTTREEARRQGFLAMQFNMVVSTNERAVALWQRMGFAIVGTLPKAFRHSKLGLVDAYVMYQFL